jgi:hypothetical protein
VSRNKVLHPVLEVGTKEYKCVVAAVTSHHRVVIAISSLLTWSLKCAFKWDPGRTNQSIRRSSSAPSRSESPSSGFPSAPR